MDKVRAGYQAGWVSILINSLLFALKYWAGLVTGSIALMADAWHTLSDSISSIVIVIATRLSSRKPDKEHPFGHGRWEQIAALIIAFILAIVAYDFFKDSIIHLRHKEATVFGTLAIIVTVTSVGVKEALAQYAFYIARKTQNLSVKADGWHHRSDALSSIVVLIGILFAKKFWWIDGLLGIIIAIMLFYATYKIAREAIAKLLGEEPDKLLVDKIIETANRLPYGNLQLHHFHIHNYTNHQELTFHIKLDNNLSIIEAHSIATIIENIIHQEFSITATAHIEPLDCAHTSD
ncbi:MAG: Ferrous-iron efflux pump FieF [Bacteroidetes bacterium ADurb.Bin408]|nr:MAG: Ferrous-iron efflux pump FieF [Bacteroidetes bacterium ADurb.Bin408]